ncbi:hypothetical protein [Sabulicella rubraurantiaca]|uniref:hypothetical protein n=1 Tax=Sabulicella rubraurantiaca TaxID=2811429 RepID=UPI001A9621E3|nr:hypothetical protein [Sabulicella rubraurantiaca]
MNLPEASSHRSEFFSRIGQRGLRESRLAEDVRTLAELKPDARHRLLDQVERLLTSDLTSEREAAIESLSGEMQRPRSDFIRLIRLCIGLVRAFQSYQVPEDEARRFADDLAREIELTSSAVESVAAAINDLIIIAQRRKDEMRLRDAAQGPIPFLIDVETSVELRAVVGEQRDPTLEELQNLEKPVVPDISAFLPIVSVRLQYNFGDDQAFQVDEQRLRLVILRLKVALAHLEHLKEISKRVRF